MKPLVLDQPTVADTDRRRDASRRLPILDTGRSDPWHYPPPSGGYTDAAQHLDAVGLTPAPPADFEQLRDMWRAGDQQRNLAGRIARCWGVTR